MILYKIKDLVDYKLPEIKELVEEEKEKIAKVTGLSRKDVTKMIIGACIGSLIGTTVGNILGPIIKDTITQKVKNLILRR